MFRKIIKSAYNHLLKNTAESDPYIASFGYVLLALYPGFYFFNYLFAVPKGYENLFLRLIIGMLGLSLILRKYWPNKLKLWLPLYWHFTLVISLPFFFIFMLLNNQYSTVWHVNGLVGMVLLMLFADWISYILMTLIGSIMAVACFYYFHNSLSFNFDILGTVGNYSPPVIYFFLFSNKKQIVYKQKLETLKALGGTIAHEMRTPLASIQATINALDNILLRLVNSYKLSKQSNLIAFLTVTEKELNWAIKSPEHIKKINKEALLTIDMLLAKIVEDVNTEQFITCSIAKCINEAIESYPMNDEQKQLIRSDDIIDFNFVGNEQFIIHIFYNLIKNSLYFINKANRGVITIRVEKKDINNIVYFRDTATGISKKTLPYIFDKFYTNSRFGTGLGLAFCKMVMESMGGSIKCSSVENEYTEFELNFPILLEKG